MKEISTKYEIYNVILLAKGGYSKKIISIHYIFPAIGLLFSSLGFVSLLSITKKNRRPDDVDIIIKSLFFGNNYGFY